MLQTDQVLETGLVNFKFIAYENKITGFSQLTNLEKNILSYNLSLFFSFKKCFFENLKQL